MNKKSFTILAAVTAVVVIAAVIVTRRQAPETTLKTTALYPGLVNKVNDVERIQVKSADNETDIRRKGDSWVIANRGGFPPVLEKVKGLVLNIAQLRVLDTKTHNPKKYYRLHLQDVSAKGSKAIQVILYGAKDKQMASLLIGKRRAARGDADMQALYVRKTGDPQSLLVQGNVDVSATPSDWMQHDLTDIKASRIQEIDIDPAQGDKVVIRKDKPDDKLLRIENIPDGKVVKSQVVVESLASALQELQFDDAGSPAVFKLPEKHAVNTYHTFDGLVAKVSSAVVDGKTHAAFSFSYDAAAAKAYQAAHKAKKAGDKGNDSGAGKKNGAHTGQAQKPKETVEQEVKRLNAATKGWVYVLPGFKGELLSKNLADLTKAKPKEVPTRVIGPNTKPTKKPPPGMSAPNQPPALPPGMQPGAPQ